MDEFAKLKAAVNELMNGVNVVITSTKGITITSKITRGTFRTLLQYQIDEDPSDKKE
jgi:hypothetical protein